MDSYSITTEEAAVYDELKRRTFVVDLPSIPDPLAQLMLENVSRLIVCMRADKIPFRWVMENFIDPLAAPAVASQDEQEAETWDAVRSRLIDAADDIIARA